MGGGLEPRRRCTQAGVLVLRMARENPSRVYALLACDFFGTVTLSGARLYVLAVIAHTGRRIRALGAAGHPTASQRRMRGAGHAKTSYTPQVCSRARSSCGRIGGPVCGGFVEALAAGQQAVVEGAETARITSWTSVSSGTSPRSMAC